MRRILAIVVVFLASIGGLVLAMNSGAGVAAPKAAVTTDITFREGLCGDKGASCKQVEVGKSTISYGANMIFTIPLYQGKTVVGKEQGTCVYLQKKSHAYFCTYNLTLQGGTVSVQGKLLYDGTGRTIPITGGIKAFEGAYGHIHQHDGFPARYTLHIVTP
jgi:hypothetical protein